MSTAKELIANAITAKGVSTSITDSFITMADNIGLIRSSLAIDKIYSAIYGSGNNCYDYTFTSSHNGYIVFACFGGLTYIGDHHKVYVNDTAISNVITFSNSDNYDKHTLFLFPITLGDKVRLYFNVNGSGRSNCNGCYAAYIYAN